MRSSSRSTDTIYEPALSASASTASMSAFGYYSKQQELLKAIQDAQSMLSTICQDHRSDRFPLLYPKYGGYGGDSLPQLQQANTRSRSRTGTGRFQLLNLSRTPTPTSTGHDLSVLDESSLGRLLLGRLEECKEYLERMMVRVKDRSSRVLVTGDVNGGKSTFINALLRHDPPILPMDQQPCTQAFCEVVPVAHDDTLEHDSFDQVLSVKAIPDYNKYAKANANNDTFDSMSLSRMQTVIQEEDTPYQWYIVKCPVQRTSMLCNELVQVSLIDSPGLNSDLFKTMNLFAKQEELDVIVFVINAANHVTLSARQFLETASQDKQYIFVVVNKFDDIRNKEKCKRIILQQISEVLPLTASASEDLLHFVSAKQHLDATCEDVIKTTIDDSFDQLEHALADFILSKRTLSKLLPAKTYLCNLLCDLTMLFEHNERHCQQALMAVRRDIDVLSPCYEELVKREVPLKQDVLHGVTDCSVQIYTHCQSALSSPLHTAIVQIVDGVPWMGWWQVWRWRRAVLQAVGEAAVVAVRDAESAARDSCSRCVDYLQVCCMEHAPSVYTSNPTTTTMKAVDFDTDVDTLLTIPTWSLFDTAVLFGGVRAVVAGCGVAVGAMVPFFATASGHHFSTLSPLLTSLLSRRPRLLILTLLVATAGSTAFILSDVQRACRRHLRATILSHYATTAWLHRHSHAIESRGHQHLLAVSGALLGRFQEVLQQQRRLRAEKDLERAQLQGRLEQVVMVSRKISILYDHVRSLVIE